MVGNKLSENTLSTVEQTTVTGPKTQNTWPLGGGGDFVIMLLKYVENKIRNRYVICHQFCPSYAGDITPLNSNRYVEWMCYLNLTSARM